MSTAAPTRVLSVDVLRGLTIALMILVNDPGDWAHTDAQLDHAPWNGFTLTDLVFPSFLFLVGASIVFSLQSRIARGDSRPSLALHILRRAAILFAIKMALTAFPHFHYTHFRLYGVLTRIALCYLAAGLIFLYTRRARTLLAIIAALLIGYWVLLRFVPVHGLGMPVRDFPILDPDRNLAASLDRFVNTITRRWLHTGRLYEHTRDPEGLLSTLPAIATTLIGALAALWMRRSAEAARRIKTLPGLLLAAVACLLAGLLWSPWFPINKNLWTSSYVLFAAGWSLLLLGLLYGLIDLRRLDRSRTGRILLYPWLVFGSNAIFAFVFSNFIVEIMLWIKVPDGPAHTITSWNWVYRHLFSHGNSTNVTSLAFALAFVLFCFVPTWLLYRKRIFLKI
jgi:predicted acyltransferase